MKDELKKEELKKEEPKVEFVPVQVEDIVATSSTSGPALTICDQGANI